MLGVRSRERKKFGSSEEAIDAAKLRAVRGTRVTFLVPTALPIVNVFHAPSPKTTPLSASLKSHLYLFNCYENCSFTMLLLDYHNVLIQSLLTERFSEYDSSPH